MKHSGRKRSQLIKARLTYGRTTPWQASKCERKRGRDLTWTLRGMPAPEWVVENWPGSATILAVRCKGTRDGKAVDETRYYVTSLRTGAKALLLHVRYRWSIENSWHWARDVPLREDAHRYREANGVQIMATLRSLAMNALRMDGYWSITEGLATLAHDIRGLLSLLGWQQPSQELCST
ncbi:ISAs1 family transposase [Cyanobium sp. HWJ4-Hawea]|uniref:ISAs1 family transposase n=1 Tax=Cyanobium sp. HWJ4-Hawea TaxID=2823713 RepID=UPI0020CE5219|nr:ISAs1 family transposase [Cyanobium sp. HWJ4-Hawea]MCP9808479.1 ISAs1 family transposase [Cyanobium sp. HWJ4-Hawea]